MRGLKCETNLKARKILDEELKLNVPLHAFKTCKVDVLIIKTTNPPSAATPSSTSA